MNSIKRSSYLSTSSNVKRHKIEHKKEKKTEDDENEHSEGEEQEINDPLMELIRERENVSIEDNHIYFRTDVCDKSIGKLIRIINHVNRIFDKLESSIKITKLEPNPIYLHITSNGGSCLMGFVASDIIKNSRVPIFTIIEGYAISAATHLSVVGKRRFITENSVMLIHQLSGAAYGKYSELKDDAANSDLLMERLRNLYLKNTKIKKNELDKLLNKDIFLSAEKCIELGLADEIYRGEHMIKY